MPRLLLSILATTLSLTSLTVNAAARMGTAPGVSASGANSVRNEDPKLTALKSEMSTLIKKYNDRGIDLMTSGSIARRLETMNLGQLREIQRDTHRMSRIQLEIVNLGNETNNMQILSNAQGLMAIRAYFLEVSDLILFTIERQVEAGRP